jgi:hypothetical protein
MVASLCGVVAVRVGGIEETIVVDVANVMGARADGWWKDRAGAAARLCGEVAALAGRSPGRYYVLVLEGQSRRAADSDLAQSLMDSGDFASLVIARGSGDDTITRIAAELGKSCTVVTADRELRQRCTHAGAAVTGPRWLLAQLGHVI